MPSPLPSLDLLQVFEACARRRGFTAAALELGMTQPAVSQQIRRLEQQLGTQLFTRVHRGVEPTAAGLALLSPLQDALAMVQDAVLAASAQRRDEVLTLATDFAFAACWLMPRLAGFYAQHPHTSVSLVTSNRALLQLPADVDLAIVFGDGHIARGDSRLLWHEQVLPVCAPSLLAQHGGDEQAVLRDAPRLHLRPAPGQHWFDWNAVESAWGPAPASAQDRPVEAFDNYTLLLDASLAGHGVAIGWRHLVDRLVQQGLLCRLRATPLASGLGYHLVQHQRKRARPGVLQFVAWLAAQMPTKSDATVDCDHG